MIPRWGLRTALVGAILLLASSHPIFSSEGSSHELRTTGFLKYDTVNQQIHHPDVFVHGTSHLGQFQSLRQDTIPSDGTDGSENNPADGTTTDGGSGPTELIPEAAQDETDTRTDSAEGGEGGGEGSTTGSDEASSSDSTSGAPAENEGDAGKTETGDEGAQKEDEKSAGNSTDPFDAFLLMQMVEVSSGDAFEQVTIYEHGSFVGRFENAPNTSNIDELSDPNDELWYTETEYADRIAFRFTYTPDSKDFVITEPLVSAGSSVGVLPTVQDFKNDPSTGGGSFTVLYRCQRDAPQKAHIAIKLQVTADRAIETMWTKKCGSGRFEKLQFGFKTHDGSVSLFNPDGTYGTDEQRTLEVGPLDTSTVLSMKLIPPAQNLQFLDPYVSSDSDEVSLQLRDTISGATLTSDTETSFSILYDCKSATTATIDFKLEIPPWDNITAQWRKDCGGSNSRALLIGTTGSGSYDVMQDGELSSRYNVTDQTELDNAWGAVEVIPANVDTKRFDITNSDDTSDIHIQTITTTMSNPEVVTTIVNTPLLGTRSYLPSTGDVISRDETKSLSLHFLCKRQGKSLVLVTLPTLRYKNVEFGFIKECDEPKAYHHSGFLQTASSLMAVFMILVVLAAIGTCFYLRRRQGTKYAAVPTSDPVIP